MVDALVDNKVVDALAENIRWYKVFDALIENRMWKPNVPWQKILYKVVGALIDNRRW